MSPWCFTPGSPHRVLASSMGALCRSNPYTQSRTYKTQGEGVETSTPSWPQRYLHSYLITSKARTAVQSQVDHFLGLFTATLISRDQAPVFLDQLFPTRLFPRVGEYSSRSRAHGMSALHHSSYTMNSHEGQRFSQQSWFFMSLSSYLLWIVFVRQLSLVATPSRLLSTARMVVINNFQPMNCFGRGPLWIALCCLNDFLKVKWYHWKTACIWEWNFSTFRKKKTNLPSVF